MTKQSTTKAVAPEAKIAASEAKPAVSKAVETPQDVVTKTANDATKVATDAGKEVAERAAVTAREASAQVASKTEDTQKSLGETIEKLSVRMHGLSSFGQQNLEALSKASEISAKAFENFSGEIAAYTKKAHEDRIAAVQDLSNAKSPTELVEKQMSFAQHALDGWAQQAIRMSEIYTSATKEAAVPLGARVSAVTAELQSTAR